MSSKPDAKETPAAPEKAGGEAHAAAPAKSGGIKAMLPLILAVVVAPATCWAVAEFVLLPRLQQKLAAAQSGELPEAHAEKPAAKAHGEKKGHGGKESAEEGAGDVYEFSNVVVNLAGTMGTRYLKASFVITGTKPDTINEIFTSNKAKLTDVTLGVLSSQTLADLEEPGSKNVLREKLITAYNQALGSRVAEQVYFSDFVVQ
jgi:flagellar protein FliL